MEIADFQSDMTPSTSSANHPVVFPEPLKPARPGRGVLLMAAALVLVLGSAGLVLGVGHSSGASAESAPRSGAGSSVAGSTAAGTSAVSGGVIAQTQPVRSNAERNSQAAAGAPTGARVGASAGGPPAGSAGARVGASAGVPTVGPVGATAGGSRRSLPGGDRPAQRGDAGASRSTNASAPPDSNTAAAASSAARPDSTPMRTNVSGTGWIVVNSRPWGDVFIDGKRVGSTPQAFLPLPAGLHRVEVQRDGFRPYMTMVTIAPGDTSRLTQIVLEVRQ